MIQRTSKKQGHMYLRVAQRTQKVPRTRLFHHVSCVGIHFRDCFTLRLLVDTRIPNRQIFYNPPTPLPCLRGRRKGRANQTVLAVPELGFR